MKEIILNYLSFVTLKDITTYIVLFLSVLGIGIDLNPKIKVNPIRWCLAQIGKMLNADVNTRLDKMETNISNLSKTVGDDRYNQDQTRIKDIRSRILDFSNSLAKRERDLDEFEDIMDLDIEYVDLLKKYGMKNGRTTRAMENIRNHYDKLRGIE